MNTSEILRRLPRTGTCAVLPRDCLPKKLPPGKVGYVVNTDSLREPGEHWIAMYFDGKGRGEFFCSFGLPPIPRDFIKFMNRVCPQGWCFSRQTLQHPESSTCGKYCIYFLKQRFAGKSYLDYLSKFSKNTIHNDRIINHQIKTKKPFRGDKKIKK